MNQNERFLATLHAFKSIFMRHSMQNVMRFSRDSGCSMPQLSTLMLIHRLGTSTVSDIGDELGVSSAAASQMLDRLVQEGLVYRTENPEDRRVKKIDLTEEGNKVLMESIHVRHSWMEEVALSFSSSEKEKIIEALRILIEKAENFAVEDVEHGNDNTNS
jgi:DNA-binding MarR family transcriptional regulator